ncbi:hypothetical protein ACQPU1_04190 [Clostridium paraputrificum]|uniref:hypothetical protein n=1 Tax=Clostridium TaxID=1485 RepID=UPI003D33BE86
MSNEFDDLFKDFIDDEFSNVKASSEFKKDIITNAKRKSLKETIINVWNYKVELEIRTCIAAILLIVAIPSIYIFAKADEIKKNEIKKYDSVEYRIK